MMDSFSVLQAISYISLGVFLSLFILRTLRISRLPSNLRWELYPIPGRNGHGCTGEEDVSRLSRLMQELKYMGHEILLFRTYFKRKRPYWYFVYPLHIAMYLYLLWLLLTVAGAVALARGLTVATDSQGMGTQILFYVSYVAGILSFFLMAASTTGLVIMRTADRGLRLYTTPVIYFNLIFALMISLTGLLNWLLVDRTFSLYREYFKSLMTFAPMAGLNPLMTANILLTCLFIVYVPCSRMMHFVTKYFVYHKILWESGLAAGHPEQSPKVRVLLGKRIAWVAPHVSTGKTWQEMASEKMISSSEGTR